MASTAAAPSFQAPPASLLERAGIGVPLALGTVLFYLILIPEQISFRAAGAMLFPYRLFLIPAFFYLLRQALRGDFRFAWPDIFIALGCLWIWVASFVTSGSIEEMINQGGAHTLDIALAYLVTRFAIRSPRDFRVFLILIAPGLALAGGIMVAESLSHKVILQPMLSQITGVPSKLPTEIRLGLLRAAGPFPHPILAGIVLGSFLALYALSGIRGWPKWLGVIGAITAFFSMSSAALLALVSGTVLLAFDWLVSRLSNLSWRIFLFAMAIAYVTIELTTKSGFFNLLVRYASFNTVSSYNRVLIWQLGSLSVQKNPWFGIGYDDWERPLWYQWSSSFSVDHFWLLQAMRFGLPLSLMLLLATALAVFLVAVRSTKLPPHDARLLRGVAISLSVFALGAVSVALWLNAMVWFFMLVGIAVSLGTMPGTQLGTAVPRPFPHGRKVL